MTLHIEVSYRQFQSSSDPDRPYLAPDAELLRTDCHDPLENFTAPDTLCVPLLMFSPGIRRPTPLGIMQLSGNFPP